MLHGKTPADLELLQIGLALRRGTVAMEAHAAELASRSRGAPSQTDEVLFEVVAVQFGATEDEGSVHGLLMNGSHHVVTLQQFDCLR